MYKSLMLRNIYKRDTNQCHWLPSETQVCIKSKHMFWPTGIYNILVIQQTVLMSNEALTTNCAPHPPASPTIPPLLYLRCCSVIVRFLVFLC